MRTFGGIALGFLIGFLLRDWSGLDEQVRDEQISDTVERTIRVELRRPREEQEYA